MRSIGDLLREHPFFDGLEPDQLDLVAGCGVNVRFRPGGSLFDEGTPADHFYVLRRGRVAIEVAAPHREPIVIETVGPGEIVGISWLLPPYRWTFDGRARDDVGAIQVNGACLRSSCVAEPTLGVALYRRFAGLIRERLQATRLQLLDLYGAHAD